MVCRLQNVQNGWVGKKNGYFIKISIKKNEKAPDFSGAVKIKQLVFLSDLKYQTLGHIDY